MDIFIYFLAILEVIFMILSILKLENIYQVSYWANYESFKQPTSIKIKGNI